MAQTVPKPSTSIHVYAAVSGLRWEEMGEEYIVFNPHSDEVHRLNPVAAAALSELETTTLTATGLVQRMASLMEVEANADLHQQLHAILLQFDDAGLINARPAGHNSTCTQTPPG